MLYRGKGLRPYSIYDRRRNPRFIPQDIAFQPVETDKKEHKEAKQEAFIPEIREESSSDTLRESASNERLGFSSHCPHICKIFNIDIFLDDLILLGLIFLMFQEGNDDYIFLFALIFLFLIGKE